MAEKKQNDNKGPMTQSTPLEKYKKGKKVLTPPMAAIPNMVLMSWSSERMPEMLWAVLIKRKHPGDIGYATFRESLRWLADNMGSNEVEGVTHSEIAGFSPDLRKKFIHKVVELAGTDALKPLLLMSELPAYDDWKDAMKEVSSNPEDDWKALADAVSGVLFHQTQEATDVRWVRLMGSSLGGKMRLPADMADKYNHYPNKYDQRSVRPSIRSAEMMIDTANGKGSSSWSNDFWKASYVNTVCIPEINYAEEEVEKRYEEVSDDKAFFDKPLEDARNALMNHFFKTSTTTAIDSRHEAALGMAFYALDIFIENSILQTAGTVSGRISARIIFETYITLKYLLHKENEGEGLWDTFRDYGVGQVSLVERKYEDEGFASSMVDIKKMDSIANEDKWSEYVPINLGNWDATDLRSISISVGEKSLYDKYYPYTSGFIHGSWGAIREASLQTCMNPLHRFHRVPAFGIPVLPNVNEDCRQLLNKLFKLVDQAYPGFDFQLPKPPAKK